MRITKLFGVAPNWHIPLSAMLYAIGIVLAFASLFVSGDLAAVYPNIPG